MVVERGNFTLVAILERAVFKCGRICNFACCNSRQIYRSLVVATFLFTIIWRGRFGVLVVQVGVCVLS